MYISGLDPSKTTSVPGFKKYQRGMDSDGNEWMYVQAGAAIGAGDFAIVKDGNGDAVKLTHALAGDSHRMIGVADVAFANDEWGWIQIFGDAMGQTAGNTAVDVALYTSATAGRIDDGTGSQTKLAGVRLNGAPGSAGRNSVFLAYPHAAE